VTNPNWGTSVDVERITQLYQQAQIKGEEGLKEFWAKHLNVEIGLNLRADRWPAADFWEQCGDNTLTFEELMRRSEVVTVGVDGGGLDDLLGLTLVGRESGTGKWLTWSHAWAHEIVLERRKNIAPRLLDFAKAGHLTIVKKPGEDVAAVAALVFKLRDAGLLPDEPKEKKFAVGLDRAGTGAIQRALVAPEAGQGLKEHQIIGIPQGFMLNGAIVTVERMVGAGDLVHGAQPLMAWCVGNARVETKGNAVLVTKQASGKAKIDPVMALLDAAWLMDLNPSPPRKEYSLFFVG
jgi:phage terminase large subunit-like protein